MNADDAATEIHETGEGLRPLCVYDLNILDRHISPNVHGVWFDSAQLTNTKSKCIYQTIIDENIDEVTRQKLILSQTGRCITTEEEHLSRSSDCFHISAIS